MLDPQDVAAIEAVQFATDFEVHPVVADRQSLLEALERYYDGGGRRRSRPTPRKAPPKPANNPAPAKTSGKTTAGETPTGAIDDTPGEISVPESTDEAPIVRFVNDLIADAAGHQASDIHLEHYSDSFRIRYRVDGMLHEVLTPPARYRDAIVSRLKIMADLDIAERRLPQDGAIRFDVGGRPIDVRVSTAPTIYGEKVVLRLLDKQSINLDLEQLGFEADQLALFEKAVGAQSGVNLVTGPTGSGKTTTLYAAVKRLNEPTRNIMTVEDPVEYDIAGINQVNVNPEIGLSFARALRGFLRQDPDVILVGEVRDKITADICIQSALTGHLVFSTVHTNDVAGTINRLVNMGVEPFMLAASLTTIVAQRLLRRTCTHCREPISYPAELLKRFGLSEAEMEGVASFKGHGCERCMNLGYSGQIGIFEVLPVDDRLRTLIGEQAGVTAMRQHAVDAGMHTLRQAAVAKFKRGLTDLEEIERVLGS
ncbi:MAG: type II secretion system protein GspE [Candidatus Coatesbacteria bacterium]|nr:type II secretion system protein GspE [Candidatus Coatesbacteria bacterium]